jgi:hypothetical protein
LLLQHCALRNIFLRFHGQHVFTWPIGYSCCRSRHAAPFTHSDNRLPGRGLRSSKDLGHPVALCGHAW